ncbi:MAG: redoxin domain-containing protein [Acidobacteria bacterium]|nr:redoxin domain-containing protein [Acidobacteriota bacterium]
MFFAACATDSVANNNSTTANKSAPTTESKDLSVNNVNSNTTNAGPTLGAPAPTFSLEDQDGKKVSLSDFAGKVVVLEWINPDCPFVKRHYDAKTMTTTANKYKDKDVVWLAINTTHYMGKDKYKEWIKTHNLSYPILDDHEGTVGKMYGAKTTPHMFIVGKDGKLVYQGGVDDDNAGDKGKSAINYIDQALAELTVDKPVSVATTRPYGCSVKYAKN